MFEIDPLPLSENPAGMLQRLLDWLGRQPTSEALLISSSASPERVKQVQQTLGKDRAAALIEGLFSSVAVASAELGFNTLVVAGGETAGAVVQALGLGTLEVGPEIEPGVPWTFALPERRLALALKSGNFGSPDFFEKALRVWA